MGIVEKLRHNSVPLCFTFGFMGGVSSSVMLRFPVVVFLAVCLAVWFLARHHYYGTQNPFFLPWVPRFSRSLLWFMTGVLLALLCLLRIGHSYAAEATGFVPDHVKTMEGVLVSDSLNAKHGQRATVWVQSCEDNAGVRISSSFRVLVYFDSAEAFHSGDRLSFNITSLKRLESLSWAWLASASIIDCRKAQGIDGLRGRILDGLDASLSSLDKDLKGFIFALLLGRQDELDPDMQTAFYGSGCAHLVALSGMHIALVAALLVKLVQPFAGINTARLVGFLGAALFIWIAGPFPSALRALVMFALFQLASWSGRRISGVAILCVSGPMLAFVDPLLPLSLGFQLSFWALLGIMVCGEALLFLLRRPLLPLLAMEFSTGIAAQLCTSFLLVAHGLRFQPQGLVAGIILAPLVLVFMAVSCAALVLACAGLQPTLAVLEPVLSLLYRVILAIGAFFSSPSR